MGKHSKNINNKKKSIDKTIRIDDLSQIQSSKSKNSRKKINTTTLESKKKILQNKESKHKNILNAKDQGKELKKTTSKFKKFLLKIILFIFLVALIAFGIWQIIEANKWQTLAKQMCSNTNSVVIDLERKYYCYTWKSKNS